MIGFAVEVRDDERSRGMERAQTQLEIGISTSCEDVRLETERDQGE